MMSLVAGEQRGKTNRAGQTHWTILVRRGCCASRAHAVRLSAGALVILTHRAMAVAAVATDVAIPMRTGMVGILVMAGDLASAMGATHQPARRMVTTICR
jgi:hypothetical protein